jgi:hypothetical protein
MRSYAICHLAQIDLPSHTARLTAGGLIRWGGFDWQAKDVLIGSIDAVETMEEGVSAQVPAFDVTFLPPADVDAGSLAQPGWQKSRARFWEADFDMTTGNVVGTPTLLVDGLLDQAMLSFKAGRRELAMTIISSLERLFEGNIGNALTPLWHKSIWPGETGHDQATGLSIPVAWGAEAPVRPVQGTAYSNFNISYK